MEFTRNTLISQKTNLTHFVKYFIAMHKSRISKLQSLKPNFINIMNALRNQLTRKVKYSC